MSSLLVWQPQLQSRLHSSKEAGFTAPLCLSSAGLLFLFWERYLYADTLGLACSSIRMMDFPKQLLSWIGYRCIYPTPRQQVQVQ